MQIIKFTYRLWIDWIRSVTARVHDPRIEAKRNYTMEQVVFSGLMVFILKDFHQTLERKKILNDQKLFDRHELICLDGTGQISSQKIQCEKCLVQKLRTQFPKRSLWMTDFEISKDNVKKLG